SALVQTVVGGQRRTLRLSPTGGHLDPPNPIAGLVGHGSVGRSERGSARRRPIAVSRCEIHVSSPLSRAPPSRRLSGRVGLVIGRRAVIGGVAVAAVSGCARPKAPPGRRIVTLWFSYGGKNREVLLDLVKKFHAAQNEVWVEATYQGDYFEALAKLRT